MNSKTFDVDVSSIIEATSYLDAVPSKVGSELAYAFRGLARGLLIAVFEDAMIRANAEGGFPEPFQNHVLSVVRTIPIISTFSNNQIFIEVDFDEIGTTSDLERGFHQGAKLADGGRLWQEAYTGQPLKQPNAHLRYRVWNAVRYGATEVKMTHRRPFKLPEWATWENTMDARIDIWGDKAPEWLYIQFGQHFKPPYVPAGSVFEDFAYQLNEEGSLLVEEIVAIEIETANIFSAKGITVSPTANRSIQLLAGFAGLSNAGNPYRRGQFISRIPRV